MQVGLLLIAFGLKTIAIPVPLDDLFASISSSSDDLFSPDNSLLSGSLGTGDQLIAATSPDLQWDSQDSDLLLASTEPSLFDEQLASSGTCDEFQSSLDSYDDLDPLIARDVADLFPGLNELTAPLNELKKAPACSIPNNPKKPSRPKQQVDPNTPPDNIAPDLFIMVGLEEGQCPTTHPVPLYCEGPWFNFNYVRGCTPCKFQPPLILFFFTRPIQLSQPHVPGCKQIVCKLISDAVLQTLLMYAAVLDSFCCQNFEPLVSGLFFFGEIEPPSAQERFSG